MQKVRTDYDEFVKSLLEEIARSKEEEKVLKQEVRQSGRKAKQIASLMIKQQNDLDTQTKLRRPENSEDILASQKAAVEEVSFYFFIRIIYIVWGSYEMSENRISGSHRMSTN